MKHKTVLMFINRSKIVPSLLSIVTDEQKIYYPSREIHNIVDLDKIRYLDDYKDKCLIPKTNFLIEDIENKVAIQIKKDTIIITTLDNLPYVIQYYISKEVTSIDDNAKNILIKIKDEAIKKFNIEDVNNKVEKMVKFDMIMI